MKIIISTGGTGGHIFPAIQVAEELKKSAHEVIFVGSFGKWKNSVADKGFSVKPLKLCGFRSKAPLQNIKALFLMIIGLIRALMITIFLRPKVVVGFGGYGSFPAVLAASCLGVPTVIHEQNTVPGKANKLLRYCVSKIAVSFEQSEKCFNRNRTVLTGCPSRQSTRQFKKGELLKGFGLEEKVKTILIAGGSQGSVKLNEECIKAIAKLKNELDIQTIHLTGQGNYEETERQYEKYGIRSSIFAFSEKMEEIYSVSDMAITRAGGAAISEIIERAIPTILVPYPFSAGGHQKKNADVLKETGAALVIEEKEMDKTLLSDSIRELIKNEEKAIKMKNALRVMQTKNSAGRIKDMVEELAK